MLCHQTQPSPMHHTFLACWLSAYADRSYVLPVAVDEETFTFCVVKAASSHYILIRPLAHSLSARAQQPSSTYGCHVIDSCRYSGYFPRVEQDDLEAGDCAVGTRERARTR